MTSFVGGVIGLYFKELLYWFLTLSGKSAGTCVFLEDDTVLGKIFFYWTDSQAGWVTILSG